MGTRRQTLAHKQRMPTSQAGTDKYAFCALYDGHFVDNKQSHCRPVVRSSSQSELTEIQLMGVAKNLHVMYLVQTICVIVSTKWRML